jgi:nucleotide-binding universal stress UspA family protein
MKILATFDGSVFGESIIPQLRYLCGIAGAELVLLRVEDVPQGQASGPAEVPATGVTGAASGRGAVAIRNAQPQTAENKEQAVERVRAEMIDYLRGIAAQLPAGTPTRTEVILDADVRSAIVKFAIKEAPDMIVMATHGHTGLMHVLFGDVAESVVRSGVAPVLLVHPQHIAQARRDT